jgi:hypothetical protein
MKKLSPFDLGMAIAFVVVAVLGGAAWWYLSGQLQDAQSEVTAAAGKFDTYSKKEVYLPTRTNVKTLQDDIALMTAQLDPIVQTRLQSPGNKLPSIERIDTVTWKRNLDDEVRQLNSSAKLHGLVVPKNFYYGFSRYLNQNPAEEATPVLSRQQLAIKEIADILINAPVRGITSVKRTYEEDAGSAMPANTSRTDSDLLPGGALEAPGGVYTAYPFEVEFVCDTEGFRKVVNSLMQSPYVFVIRGVTVENSKIASPKIGDLDKMAGTSASSQSLINSSPGEVAATQSTVGPQFLFGDETLHVRARIDLIEWHGISTATPQAGATSGRARGRGANGGAGRGANGGAGTGRAGDNE